MENKIKSMPVKELFPMLLARTQAGERASFVVSGMSMWPFMRHGKDVVFIEKCEPEKVKPGDVVLLYTPDQVYLLHRIMKCTKRGIVTAGDSKCRYDGEFPRECVKAKVVMVKRGTKYIRCDNIFWRIIFGIWRKLFHFRRKLLIFSEKVRKLK